VFYLYSRCAVSDILGYNPAARFIVCVRNPIEMAPSWHSEAVHSAGEDLLDFEEAWRAIPERAQGRRIPRYCMEPQLLDYGAVCRVGSQLERLYRTVSRDSVHVVLLDDLRRDPRGCYDACLAFLGVPSDGRREFPVYNASRRFRSWSVHRLCYWSRTMKRSLGVSARFNIARTVQDLNVRPMPRPPLSPGLHAELRDYFAEEISLLGSLLGRDLHHWLSQRHRRRERGPH
jgi:hypothetical protein